MEKKTCSKCRRELSFENFHKSANKPNGLCSRCKDCRNIQRRERYSQNHDQEISWKYSWDERNPEKKKAQARRHYAKHKDAIRPKALAYRQANKEVISSKEKDGRINMSDTYIKKLIVVSPKYRGEAITQEMIQKKREELTLKRSKRTEHGNVQ